MRRALLITVLALLMAGCVKEASWPLQEGVRPALVVDGLLTDRPGLQRLRLTRPVSELNAVPEAVSGAGVLVTSGDSAWTFTENPASKGDYLPPQWFFARPGETYTLLVSSGSTVYTARTGIEPGSLFPALRFAKDEGTGKYYVDWVANAFSTANPAMWEVLADWSMVPGYETADSSDTRARLFFYTLPTLDVSEIFAPAMERVLFPAGTVVTERRYSLTNGHAGFVREMLLETNWTGGIFSVSAAGVTTNLSSGACGWFGACSVTELSVIAGP